MRSSLSPIFVFALTICFVSICVAQGPGGEIKPKPSSSPLPPAKTTPGASKAAISVKVAKVSESVQPVTITASGKAEEPGLLAIRPQVAGTIKTVAVKEGSGVHRGQVVARIDSKIFEDEVDHANAALDKARADLDAAPVGSQKRLQLELQVRQQRAARDQAYAHLAACEISAPVDGFVKGVFVSEGQTVTTDTQLFAIEHRNDRVVHVELTELVSRDVPDAPPIIRVGQPANIISDDIVAGGPAQLGGTVERVTPAPGQPNRAAAVDIVVTSSLLPVGSTVRVEINTETRFITLPSTAVLKSAGRRRVFVVQNSRAIERSVTTGRTVGDSIEVLSGVVVGQSIVVDPTGLRSGQAVNITN